MRGGKVCPEQKVPANCVSNVMWLSLVGECAILKGKMSQVNKKKMNALQRHPKHKGIMSKIETLAMHCTADKAAPEAWTASNNTAAAQSWGQCRRMEPGWKGAPSLAWMWPSSSDRSWSKQEPRGKSWNCTIILPWFVSFLLAKRHFSLFLPLIVVVKKATHCLSLLSPNSWSFSQQIRPNTVKRTQVPWGEARQTSKTWISKTWIAFFDFMFSMAVPLAKVLAHAKHEATEMQKFAHIPSLCSATCKLRWRSV